ncbi:MAG: citryl-CoA lyase [Syntrophobacteraceae bacterium]
MRDEIWNTSITKVEPNRLTVRGYRIDELIGNITFAQAVFLTIKGELPDKRKASMLDAMLVASIDHGVTPPSCITARTIASTGSPLTAALAGGILAISKHHGGAIEDYMRLFLGAVVRKRQANLTERELAEVLVRESKQAKKKLPGFGHRIHTNDPRTSRLFQIASELGFAGEYVAMADALADEIERSSGKRLPINVDGAIAALLCEMDFAPELANAFFIIARIPGLVSHIHEEQTEMRPMRHIDTMKHVYDGPEGRKLREAP